MSIPVEYVSGHLFVNGYWGRLCSNDYFRCYEKRCPFSILMKVETVSGEKVAVSCACEVIPVHCHGVTDKQKGDVRMAVANQLQFIRTHPNDPNALAFANQHEVWNKEARRTSRKYRDHLLDIEAVKVYGLSHPEKSAKQIKVDCCVNLNTRSICNILLREKQKAGKQQNLQK